MPVAAADTRIAIAHGDVRAEFLPALGGALARLRWRGADLLRPASGDCSDPRETACFPLAPFANRIANGTFHFGGQRIELGSDEAAAPHALHGFGWRHPWTIADHQPDRLTLTLDYDGAEWPWRTRLRQRCVATEAGIELSLSIANLSDRPMPAGLGFHPYFSRNAETCLVAEVRGGWHPDERGIAARWSAAPRQWLGSAHPIDAMAPADLCGDRWNGVAEVQGGEVSARLTASANLPCLHVYVPADGDYFCAEPVSHAPDAPNRDDVPPLPVLDPGECLEINLRIEGRKRPETALT